ncbi:RNA 2',3'-cyclic phosphodiesterase [Candidatus Woesearchaeota archaeon]|nr:RNA 2',3'-cyclic phosphodiesterase [Candidatus Woesearchaeota archaeon]
MRLFIALDASPLKGELTRLQELLQNRYWELRPVTSYHLTLHFLGEVDEPIAAKLQNQLSAIKFPCFSLTLDHICFFPPTGAPKVVWVGVEPRANVEKLHREIGRSIQDIRLQPEKRFSPHLTLARVKQVTDKEGAIQELKGVKPRPVIWDINNFFLIRSTLTPQGPVYENMKEIPLKK